jgi:signal transduction histidine kinase/NO-binding membrane sensor protein with MHYT domain/CheY-like chemotaxis protein
MIKVLACLQTEHDLRLVVLAGVVCAFSSILAVILYSRTSAAAQGRFGRLAIAGFTAGAGIWSTHFIAMLAFRPGLPTAYSPLETFGSLVVAVAFSTLGFGLAGSRRMSRPWLAAGPVLGLGVALMHYTGMAGFRTQGYLTWDPSYLAASICLGVVFSTLALAIARPATSIGSRLVGALVLTFAICALHFTGMAAVTIVPDSAISVPRLSLSNIQLAIFAAALTVVGLSITVGLYVATRSRRVAFSQLREAIAAMPDGMAIFDADDRLVAWNPQFEAFTGLGRRVRYGAPRDGVVRAACACIGAAEDAGDLKPQKKLRDALQPTGQSRAQQSADGRWWRVEHRRTSNGGSVSVFVDVTLQRDAAQKQAALIEELKVTEARLLDAVAAAVEASRAKSSFLANMSHELRTPLNGVLGLTGALLRRVRDPESQEMIGLIEQSGRTLERVLSDILDLSKIEACKVSIETADFDLLREVEVAILPFAEKARGKGVAFELDTGDLKALRVASDALRIRQILSNLVSNAVKFTEHGAVRVRLQVAETEAGYLATVEVEDTGVGFQPGQADRLFQAFEQDDASITRRFGGTGLGLPICRGLADLLGGKLTARSEPGVGSCFTVEIPLLRAAEADLQARAAGPAEVASNLRVLLAEDHPTNQRVIELLLQPFDADLVIVENGKEAVAACERQPFDLVLMDMQMPVMDGLEATREIRKFEIAAGRAPVPLAMLTANVSSDFVALSLEAGAHHHIPKPVTLETLMSGIDTCLAVAAMAPQPLPLSGAA